MVNLVKSNGNGGGLAKGSLFARPAKSKSMLFADPKMLPTGGGDNRWRAHRVARFTNGMRVEWEFPTTAKEREEGSIGVTEIHRNTNFVGVRGIVVRMNTFGFKLKERIDRDGKVTTKTICQTTKAVMHLGDETIERVGPFPLERPISTPHWGKSKPNEMNYMLQSMPHLELFGSRPPVGVELKEGEVWTGKPRTCAECVAAMEHILGDPDDKNSSKCGADGQVLFCVFALAVVDEDKVDPMDARAPMPIKWVDVKDAGLVTIDGDKRTELKQPFILKLQGLSKSMLSSIGDGQYDRKVIPAGGPGSYLPEGVPQSVGDYWKYLHQAEAGRVVELSTGDPGYLAMTDIVIGKLPKVEYQQNSIPVFYDSTQQVFTEISEDNRQVDANGLDIEDYISTALLVEQAELSAVGSTTPAMLEEIADDEDNNSSDEDYQPSLPSTAPDVSTESNVVEMKSAAAKEEEDVTSGTTKKSSFTAFRPAGKSID